MRLKNGSAPITVTATRKATGERFWVQVRRAWDKRYYEAGDGNWYPTLGEAMRAADTTGSLNPVTGEA